MSSTASSAHGARRLSPLPVRSETPGLCLFRRYLGVPCPGCGFTRASLLVAEGRVGPALRLYPAWPLVTAYLIESGRRMAAASPPIPGAVGLAVLFAALASWLVRLPAHD